MAESPKIQLLERAMTVLGMFSADTRSLSLSEIAEQLDLYPSTAHRLLLTLEHGGFLTRNRDSRRYQLGPRLLELAGVAGTSIDVRRIVDPHARGLVHEFGESVVLGYYEDSDVVYLETFAGTRALNVTARVGARNPAVGVASGRAMLAHMPDEVAHLLTAAPRRGRPDAAVVPDAAAFRRELAAIRRRGYATDDGTFLEGVRAVASAVLDHEDRPIVALTLVALASRLPTGTMRRAGRRVAETAEAISAELRHTPNARGIV